jgi:hypothetical protein
VGSEEDSVGCVKRDWAAELQAFRHSASSASEPPTLSTCLMLMTCRILHEQGGANNCGQPGHGSYLLQSRASAPRRRGGSRSSSARARAHVCERLHHAVASLFDAMRRVLFASCGVCCLLHPSYAPSCTAHRVRCAVCCFRCAVCLTRCGRDPRPSCALHPRPCCRASYRDAALALAVALHLQEETLTNRHI